MANSHRTQRRGLRRSLWRETAASSSGSGERFSSSLAKTRLSVSGTRLDLRWTASPITVLSSTWRRCHGCQDPWECWPKGTQGPWAKGVKFWSGQVEGGVQEDYESWELGKGMSQFKSLKHHPHINVLSWCTHSHSQYHMHTHYCTHTWAYSPLEHLCLLFFSSLKILHLKRLSLALKGWRWLRQPPGTLSGG